MIFLKSFGDNLFASTSRDQTVKVWNLTAILSNSTASVGAPLTLKCQFGKVFGAYYVEAGRSVISGSDDGLIDTYSIGNGSLLSSYNSGQVVTFILVTNATDSSRIVVPNKASMKV